MAESGDTRAIAASVVVFDFDGTVFRGDLGSGITHHFAAADCAAHNTCQVHDGWTGPAFGVPSAGHVEGLSYAPAT